jgi:tetratricopeptide (TPR) repeat protein
MKLARNWILATLLLASAIAARADAPLAGAIQLFEAGRYTEAQKVFAAYAAAHPKDADGAYWTGRTLLALHDTSKAIDWLERATKLGPGRSDAFLALGRAYARGAQEASLLRKTGLAKSAREAWEKAVALDPGNVEARGDLVTFHLMAPGFMGGSADEARRQADEIGKRDPVQGAVARATIAQQEKDTAGAERILQEALTKSPGNPALRRSLGLLYQSEKKWDAAFGIYDAALAQDADAWEFLYQMGRTAALSGQRLERGAAALKRYLGHVPGPDQPPLANAHYRLGMVLEQQGNRVGARAEYQAALRLDPSLKDAKEALDKLS